MNYQITGVSLTDVWHCGVANKLQKAIDIAKLFAAEVPNFDYFKVTDENGKRVASFDTLNQP